MRSPMCFRSDDACHILAGEFTCNQIERMYYQWILYRDEVSACPEGEMEIEFTLQFDRDHRTDNRVVIYRDRGTVDEEVIFDTDTDHDDGAFRRQNVLALDICVPATSNYELEITDSTSNGFSRDGTASVFRNTVPIDTVSGDFGALYTIEIPALVVDEESIQPSQWPPEWPSAWPSELPSSDGSVDPTSGPSASPTIETVDPTLGQSASPTTAPIAGTVGPTSDPTASPTTAPVTQAPSSYPSSAPTASPSASPVAAPNSSPTDSPSKSPTGSPLTSVPTGSSPTKVPTKTNEVTDAPVPLTESPTRAPSERGESVVDIIVDGVDLSMLLDAIAEADLVDTLRTDEGPYVVVAPTNEAFEEFAQLYPDLASVLYDDEWIAHLRDFVGFHVSVDLLSFVGLTDGTYRLGTLSGDNIQARVNGGIVSIVPSVSGNPAQFVIQDIEASNGLVSVIDTVLRPDFLTRDMAELTARFFPELDTLLVEVGLDEFIQTNFGFTVSWFIVYFLS